MLSFIKHGTLCWSGSRVHSLDDTRGSCEQSNSLESSSGARASLPKTVVVTKKQET